MRVGLYFGRSPAEERAGGAHTFAGSVLAALERVETSHEFWVFHHGLRDRVRAASAPTDSRVQFVPLDPEAPPEGASVPRRLRTRVAGALHRRITARRFGTMLNRACIERHIDLLWFGGPTYERVEVPFVLTVWDLQHRRQPFFPEVSVSGVRFEERERHSATSIPRAAYVIAGNQVGKDEVIRFYGCSEERVRALELPTPDFAFDSRLGDGIDVSQRFGVKHPYLFYPAHFWPHKNHVAILEAVAKLTDEADGAFDVAFSGADRGNEAHVRAQASRLGLESRVHFVGFVSREELVALYRQAFALVFPSFFGPNNLPPLEAAALGCPVIAASAAGMREQLGDAALYFDPCTPRELEQRIRELHRDAALRSRLIESGKVRAASWTSTDYVGGMLKILDEFEPVRRSWSSVQPYVHEGG